MDEYFETRFKFDKSRIKVWRAITNFFQKFVPTDAIVLDVGAGYCGFINNILAKEKHALDSSSIVKDYAGKDVAVHTESCTGMNTVKSNYFDVVFCSNVFEHLVDADLESTMKEIKRVLKVGGIIILLQPNFKYSAPEYFDDYTHKKIFTDVSLKNYLESKGFEIAFSVPRFLPMTLNSKLPKSAFLTKLYLMSPIKPFAKQMLVIGKKT